MKRHCLALSALCLAACATAPPNAVATSSSAEADIRAQVDRWFELWSPGARAYDWEAFRDLYSEDGILVVDDFGDTITIIRSVDDYIATWAPVMAEGFSSWAFAPDTLAVQQSGELAVVTFFATANGVQRDGLRVSPRQQGTLVLAYDASENQWEITQEQLTTLPDGVR